MDPISNVDRLVMILRQRMLERTAATRPKGAASTRKRTATHLESLQALAALDAMDERQRRRALIQNILADQIGGQLINDPKFQQVVERVTEALESDEKGLLLLDRCVSELRHAT